MRGAHTNERSLTPNLPIETDLRKRASPLASAAHWRRYASALFGVGEGEVLVSEVGGNLNDALVPERAGSSRIDTKSDAFGSRRKGWLASLSLQRWAN